MQQGVKNTRLMLFACLFFPTAIKTTLLKFLHKFLKKGARCLVLSQGVRKPFRVGFKLITSQEDERG